MFWVVTCVIAVILSIFSTAIMSYISMATPIGPWIALTIVLFALLLVKILRITNQSRSVALITSAASIGGITATACGFSFPTLYFLDPVLFYSWMAHPVFFASVLTGLTFVAGLLGIVTADMLEQRLIEGEQLAFPIGQLAYKMIAAGNQIKKAYELAIGFISTAFFCVFQTGFGPIPGVIPQSITLLPSFSVFVLNIPKVQFDMWPMLWAIGFVTGHVIAIPLAVGALSQVLLVRPVHAVWFSQLTFVEFVLAFCSGMIVYGVLMSFISLPSLALKGFRWLSDNTTHLLAGKQKGYYTSSTIFMWAIALCTGFLFLRYFEFSFLSMLFLYAGSLACMYQVAIIAGKIGLAPLGRFATFVMVPAMLIFGLNGVQIVLVAAFVEICSGVAADVLFGRKMAHMLNIDRRLVYVFQVFGLIVSSLTIGIVFWVLINHFQLGSPQLLAYKAQSRQLLIHARQFDYYVLVLGALFSLVLKYCRINPTLVLGGLLMPINISLGLIFGGALTFFVAKRQDWEPFWSGVFASNSIWMLIRAVIG